MNDRLDNALPFGATTLPDGRTRFRLWAPAASEVSIVLDEDTAHPMRRAGEWFEQELPCGDGARYRYRLADGTQVPDPASRFQPEGVHGPSQVVDPRMFQWDHAEWQGRKWNEAVIYELHAGLYGGFRGVAEQLPRIAALGITAVELMPIAEFPGRRNWGYDGVLPFAPASAYGTPTELKALIDQAHGRGLMMLLDVVYNHFGPDGNYLPRYAPKMFRDDIHTPWGPAIDFRQPEVRRFFIQNALYWLTEYHFDGLRLDAVHEISDPSWIDELAETVHRTVGTERHVHLVVENERNDTRHMAHGIDAQWNDDGHHAFHVLLTGESNGYYQDYSAAGASALARVLADGFFFQGQVSSHRGRPRGTPSGNLPPSAFVLFLQNHDQIGNRPFGERLSVLAEPAAFEAAIAVQMLCPQIPMLFMGEEEASRSPFLFFTDFGDDLADAVRVGRRNEFAHFPEFSDPARLKQIPDPNDPDTFNRSVPHPDPAYATERRTLYERLIAIRMREIVPELERTHSIEAVTLGSSAVLARWRLGNSGIFTLAANFGDSIVAAPGISGRCLFAMPDSASDFARNGKLPGLGMAAYLDATR